LALNTWYVLIWACVVYLRAENCLMHHMMVRKGLDTIYRFSNTPGSASRRARR
jgi:hypothetical protein